MNDSPRLLIFDVNETLLDLESLEPLFERLFGDRRCLREWFGQLILYSMTASLAARYTDFFTLAAGVLQMVGQVHGVAVDDADVGELRAGLLCMPPHPDVEPALRRLHDAGFRMVTLTNSPAGSSGGSPLQRAALAHHFEHNFSVDERRVFKPAAAVYQMVSDRMQVPARACCMVAAHVWDTIGAQAVGMTGAFIRRRGNAVLNVPGVVPPTWSAEDLGGLADQLSRLRRD
jgi:2-haloacid dehalogenase